MFDNEWADCHCSGSTNVNGKLKQGYSTRERAEAALAWYQSRNGRAKRVYRCNLCPWFHLSSQDLRLR